MQEPNPKDFTFDTVIHKGLKFVPFYSRQYIDERVQQTADLISHAYRQKHPIFIGILNGAFMFLSDLIQKLTIHNFQIQFVQVSTYHGTESTQQVRELISLQSDITDRDIIIVDDIIDTGITMFHIVKYFEEKKPRSISVCAAVWKQPKLVKSVNIEYPAIILKYDLFVLGYGMDFDEFGRNLRDIYILEKDLQKLQIKEKEFEYEQLVYQDARFLPLFSRKTIDENVKKVAEIISVDYKSKTPVFIGILNGAFVFVSDLVQKLTIYNFEIQFVQLDSTNSDQYIGLKGNIENKDIIIVDDIVDTGFTIEQIISSLKKHQPASIAVCAAVYKHQNMKTEVKVDYPCILLDKDHFLIGYGIDHEENGRNLKEIYYKDTPITN